MNYSINGSAEEAYNLSKSTEPDTVMEWESKSEEPFANGVSSTAIGDASAADLVTLPKTKQTKLYNVLSLSPNTSASDFANCSTEIAKLTDEPVKPSKQWYRLKIWEQLERNNLVLFPQSCEGRIPYFRGALEAANNLANSTIFKKCRTIKVSYDKAQEIVRLRTLESGKCILLPTLQNGGGLLRAVVPPQNATQLQYNKASKPFGMQEWGKPIGLEDKVNIDMVVVSSVAVDKKGHHIGKGGGYTDLEFAILKKIHAINENTVIVTIVHDDQVFDELPEKLFEDHDVPIDYIVTPTQIIQVAEPLPRPKGVMWNSLSNRRVLEIPFLQKIREKEISEGIDCFLKEIDSDVEEKPFPVQESVLKNQLQPNSSLLKFFGHSIKSQRDRLHHPSPKQAKDVPQNLVIHQIVEIPTGVKEGPGVSPLWEWQYRNMCIQRGIEYIPHKIDFSSVTIG